MRSPATTDNGARPHREQNLSQLQNPSRIFDERQRIEREIDILQHRLELLANRALYASRLHQISEPPDVRSSESQPPRKLKLYSGSTAGLSASHKNIPQDLSGDRLGSDSYYEDHPPLSHRSTNELPYPLSTLPLYQLPEQKSDVEAGNGSSRGLRQFDNPPPQRFQRNDNRRISEEEKPHSDVDNISEVC